MKMHKKILGIIIKGRKKIKREMFRVPLGCWGMTNWKGEVEVLFIGKNVIRINDN